MSKSIKLNISKKGVCNLVFDLKQEKINKLSSSVLLELDKILDDISSNKNIKILVISSKKESIFIAGADIKEIRDISNKNDAYKKVKKGQDILNKIELLPFPTISVIDGACMGGGLELALACDYRIATDGKKVQLGLPEVNLGIIPGFGGTQRLPKLVGLNESVKMILSGKAVNYKKAYKIGLVDLMVRQEFLKDQLNDFIAEVLKENNKFLIKRKKANKKRLLIENIFVRKIFCHFAKKQLTKKTFGYYPAPLRALKTIRKTYKVTTLSKGLAIELDEFSKLVTTDVCKNLIELFFASEEIKKDDGVNGKVVKTKEINNVSLLGAGVMGGGIAWLFSKYNFPVRMKDISQSSIAIGFNQIVKIYQQLKKIRKIDDNQIALKTSNITSTLDYTGFGNSDIVVEAIVEDLKIKKQSLSELEKFVDDNTIIASNTSSLSLSKMGTALKKPERFIGMHFFNPVNRMPLVEVIKADKTSDETTATVVNLAKKLGKTPIVVKDVAGFLVNRVLIPYINEASFLLQEGVDMKLIDKLIKQEFGMPMGPFVLADTVGIDVGYKVASILEDAYGERMAVSDLFKEISMNKSMLGKKSGKGFYKYSKSSTKLEINNDMKSIINRVITKDDIQKIKITNQNIIDRCILIMVNEASRCLEEKVVKSHKHLDLAMIMGTGFPPFRGGLLKYADQYGIKNIVEKLNMFSETYGKRFTPSNLLLKMSKNNESFY